MSTKNKNGVSSTLARESDGTIQITYTIPWSLVESIENEVIETLSKDVTVPGFRKGKAPIDRVKEKVSKETLIERALSKILPQALSESIKNDNLKPAVYPKFELVSANEKEDWQVRATTCELPQIPADYKDKILGELKSATIWTPDKGAVAKDKKPLDGEKEEKVVQAIIKGVSLNLPKILIDAEIDAKLSQLLEKTEKLGLTLETYLSSVGKSIPQIKSEYQKQAQENLTLELVLNKYIEDEKITADEKEAEELEKVYFAANPGEVSEEVRKDIKTNLKHLILRRKAVKSLVSTIS